MSLSGEANRRKELYKTMTDGEIIGERKLNAISGIGNLALNSGLTAASIYKAKKRGGKSKLWNVMAGINAANTLGSAAGHLQAHISATKELKRRKKERAGQDNNLEHRRKYNVLGIDKSDNWQGWSFEEEHKKNNRNYDHITHPFLKDVGLTSEAREAYNKKYPNGHEGTNDSYYTALWIANAKNDKKLNKRIAGAQKAGFRYSKQDDDNFTLTDKYGYNRNYKRTLRHSVSADSIVYNISELYHGGRGSGRWPKGSTGNGEGGIFTKRATRYSKYTPEELQALSKSQASYKQDAEDIGKLGAAIRGDIEGLYTIADEIGRNASNRQIRKAEAEARGMSDNELNDRIRRYAAERNYAQLQGERKTKSGYGYAKSAIRGLGAAAGIGASTLAGAYYLKRLMGR